MHVDTLIHPTGAVVAAALALGERIHAPGALLLPAIAAGIEVECRLGLALFPEHYNAGWHITATLGTLGAAAAASAVLGLDANRAAHALGIAATQPAGARDARQPGKSFTSGELPLRARSPHCLPSRPGQCSRPGGEVGLFDVFGRPAIRKRHARSRRDYIVSDISIKLSVRCRIPRIDACLEPRASAERRPHVRAISIASSANGRAGRPASHTAIGGRFSLITRTALALARRSAAWPRSTPRIRRPQIAAFATACSWKPTRASRRARLVRPIDSRTARQQHAVEFRRQPQRPLTDATARQVPRACAPGGRRSCCGGPVRNLPVARTVRGRDCAARLLGWIEESCEWMALISAIT